MSRSILFTFLLLLCSCSKVKKTNNIKEIIIWKKISYKADSISIFKDTIFERKNKLNIQKFYWEQFLMLNRNTLNEVLFIDTNGIKINNMLILKQKDGFKDTVLVVSYYNDDNHREHLASVYYFSLQNGLYSKLNRLDIEILYKRILYCPGGKQELLFYENYLKYIMKNYESGNVVQIEIPIDKSVEIIRTE